MANPVLNLNAIFGKMPRHPMAVAHDKAVLEWELKRHFLNTIEAIQSGGLGRLLALSVLKQSLNRTPDAQDLESLLSELRRQVLGSDPRREKIQGPGPSETHGDVTQRAKSLSEFLKSEGVVLRKVTFGHPAKAKAKPKAKPKRPASPPKRQRAAMLAKARSRLKRAQKRS